MPICNIAVLCQNRHPERIGYFTLAHLYTVMQYFELFTCLLQRMCLGCIGNLPTVGILSTDWRVDQLGNQVDKGEIFSNTFP